MTAVNNNEKTSLVTKTLLTYEAEKKLVSDKSKETDLDLSIDCIG